MPRIGLKMFSLITYLDRWYIIYMGMKRIKYIVNIFIKIVWTAKQNLRFLSFRILFSREWVKLAILCRPSWKQYSTIHIYFNYHHYARLLTGTEHINVCRVSCGGVSNMLLVLSSTFTFIIICGVVCVYLVHFSLGDWQDMSITILLSPSNQKYPPFPLL